jgi:hypothetical protein
MYVYMDENRINATKKLSRKIVRAFDVDAGLKFNYILVPSSHLPSVASKIVNRHQIKITPGRKKT